MPRNRDHAAAWGSLVMGTIVSAPVYAMAWLESRRRGERVATPSGVRAALAQLGWNSARDVAAAPLGCGLSNAVIAVRVGGERFVLKCALPVGTVLAAAARRFGPMPYARDVSSAARCRRELVALTRLRAAGIAVPGVIAADPDAGLLLLEHVDGCPLIDRLGGPGSEAMATELGRAVAASHRIGVALTDCHPGNALWTVDGRVVLLDLEFAETRGTLGDAFDERCGFDIAYAAAFLTGPTRAAFLRAACESPRDAGAVQSAQARLQTYAPLFARERRRQQRRAA